MGAFVFNNTSDDGEVCDDGGGWRRGGPLMDPGVVNNQAQAKDPGEDEKKDQEKPVKVSMSMDTMNN